MNTLHRKIFKNFKNSLNSSNDGFSLLELVIAVGVLLLLTVGGVVGYNQITENARIAALSDAVNDTMAAAIIYESDSDVSTNAQTAVDQWNETSDTSTYYVEIIPETELDVDLLVIRAIHAPTGISVIKSASPLN